MLKSGSLYEYNGCIVDFSQDRLQRYNYNLKRTKNLDVFADISVASFNKVASIKNNLIEIRNFEKKQIIVKLKLDPLEKVTTMALGETVLVVGREDGKVSLICMLSKTKELQFKISNNPIKSMYLNSESIMSVVSGNEIFIVNIVDRTTLSKIKEKSTISSLVGNHEKIIYVVKNKVILYSFLTKKREVVYAGEDIKDIFYKDKLLVLDRKKLLIIKNKKKFIKLDKIEADKFIAVDNKIFYTKDNEIYKSENHVLKRKTDNTVRILTVDDSETIRRVLKTTILNNFKRVEVYEAKDGHGAMKALKNYNIDVMLLDWNMPIMDGEEVVNIINELNIYPDLKIIMATTQDSTSDVRKMVNKGVCGYLIKPFTPSSIVTFTKKIIDVVLKGRDV